MLKRLQPLVALILLTCSISAGAKDQNLHEQMMHSRAVEAVVWAMPLMNYKFYRDALINAGVGPNDIGYFSEVQDWRFQTATPNNTTTVMRTAIHSVGNSISIVFDVGVSSSDVRP